MRATELTAVQGLYPTDHTSACLSRPLPFYVVLPDVTRSAAISDGFEFRISYVDSRCQNQRMCRFQALSCGRANDILKLAYLDINTTCLDWALGEPLYLHFT